MWSDDYMWDDDYTDEIIEETNELKHGRYSVSYVGYLFDGDDEVMREGLVRHDGLSWEDAYRIYTAYDGFVTITDNYYGMSLSPDGEWY